MTGHRRVSRATESTSLGLPGMGDAKPTGQTGNARMPLVSNRPPNLHQGPHQAESMGGRGALLASRPPGGEGLGAKRREWGGPLRPLDESDDAPQAWRRWARWRDGEGWTFHERDEHSEAGPTRRMRGDQSYAGLHLGRGTKWIK